MLKLPWEPTVRESSANAQVKKTASPPEPVRSSSKHRARRKGTLTDIVMLVFDVLLAAVLGAAHSVPTAFPQFWWLQIACVAGLVWRVSRVGPGRAALLGFIFGTAWLGAGVWWLFISMNRYGGLSAVLSVLAIVVLCGFLSLYLSAAMALFSKLRRNRAVVDPLLFAGCWLLAELARGVIFTGFPWAASGYAHVDSPLATLAPMIGVYGIGAMSALLGAALVLGLRVPGQAAAGGLVGVIVVVVVLVALGTLKLSPYSRAAGTLQLSLLQTNVPQNEKFETAVLPEALDWASRRLMASKADLVIAPETVVPLLPDQLPESYWTPLLTHFQKGKQAALFGRPLGSFERGYTNSAVGISNETVRVPDGYYRYDKHHLVPFGEFIPSGFRWFTNLMKIPLGDFSRGPLVAPSFSVKGERIAPTICYEDLFGEEIAARFADEHVAPTILANMTNIGWFGDTIALPQHLHISRMRALEFERPMVRATNTGTTAVIDHTGKVTHSLPPLTQGVLDAPVQARTGITAYASWASRYGLWPLWIIGALSLVIVMPLRRRED
ncbi:MAG: hypothetical protein RLZZ618_2875 [Pseudomonadota bacterium]|jgi:apolipoprotein N-acyltransferase